MTTLPPHIQQRLAALLAAFASAPSDIDRGRARAEIDDLLLGVYDLGRLAGLAVHGTIIEVFDRDPGEVRRDW